jgi:hypothetical protein
MQLRAVPFLCVMSLALVGCGPTPGRQFATPTDYVPMDQIQIQNRFVPVEVSAASLGIEVNRCVPALAPTSQAVVQTASKLPLARGTTTVISHLSSSKAFVVSGSTGVCVAQSANHYPIFAGEAFLSTANPAGVPPDVTDGWYTQIARRIAENGRVTAAYVYPNGNAYVASYWVESPNKYNIQYAAEFKKAGTWEATTYDYRFSNPSLTTVSVTKRNNAMRKTDLIDSR